MTGPSSDRIEALFGEAFELPAAERRAWVIRAAGDDHVLRDAVLVLLSAHDRSGILDSPAPDAVTPPEAMDAEVAAALRGKYDVQRRIGEGGMAVVYLARERKHDRPVVVKVLRPEVTTLLGDDRFLSEIRIVAQLPHPHIIPLLDSGSANGLLYYVMPNLGGETLRARLARGGALAPEEALPFLRDVASALAHAHAHGVVHRDLKPENVLCVGAHAFLMDFGVAKLRSGLGPVTVAGRTAAGLAVGTPAYMAPEQAAGEAVDQRADVWAWGLLARELLFGRRDQTTPLAQAPHPLPAELAALIEACQSERPGQRPRDAGSVLQRLEPLIQTSDAAPRLPRRPTRRMLTWSGIAAVLLITFLVWPRPAAPMIEAGAGPVAVTPLRNETGDSTLAVWGRMAGDWITQGLQETGRVTVVPWPVSLQAAEHAADEADVQSVLTVFREETGAAVVVSGAYYAVGSTYRFQVEIVDGRTGDLISAVPPIDVPADSLREGIDRLRQRLMGAVAARADARLVDVPGLANRPPTFESYRAFEEGIGHYNRLEYREAAELLLEAWRRDTTFYTPLVYACGALWNTLQQARVDSLIRAMRRRQATLSPYLDNQLRYFERLLQGDARGALAAIREAAAVAPGSRALYNYALTALSVNLPTEALTAFEQLQPDRGTMRGFSPYWYNRSHANHLLGRHEEELEVARELRRRYPDSRAGRVHEARALASLGRLAEVDSVVEEASALPPDTYWSQGAALVVIGEELDAHGHAAEAPRYYAAAERWLANQLTRDPRNRAHRYWLGSAMYDRGRWTDAEPYFEGLAHDENHDVLFRGLWALLAAWEGDTVEASRRLGPAPPHDLGRHTAFRARIAAIGGNTDAAVDLWSEAISGGMSGLVWLHSSARREFELLQDNERFRQLHLYPIP